MSEYDKELDSSRKEWDKARGPLERNESTVQRPDDQQRRTVKDEESGSGSADQDERSDNISK